MHTKHFPSAKYFTNNSGQVRSILDVEVLRSSFKNLIRLANMLDQTPATDYLWIFVVYDSKRPKIQCQCKSFRGFRIYQTSSGEKPDIFGSRVLLRTSYDWNFRNRLQFLTQRFVVLCNLTKDMAYPSNRETFEPIVTEGFGSQKFSRIFFRFL